MARRRPENRPRSTGPCPGLGRCNHVQHTSRPRRAGARGSTPPSSALCGPPPGNRPRPGAGRGPAGRALAGGPPSAPARPLAVRCSRPATEAMEWTEATEEVAEIEAKKGAETARSSQCCRVLPPLPPMQLGAVMPSPAHGVDTYGSCLVFSFFCLEHPFTFIIRTLRAAVRPPAPIAGCRAAVRRGGLAGGFDTFIIRTLRAAGRPPAPIAGCRAAVRLASPGSPRPPAALAPLPPPGRCSRRRRRRRRGAVRRRRKHWRPSRWRLTFSREGPIPVPGRLKGRPGAGPGPRAPGPGPALTRPIPRRGGGWGGRAEGLYEHFQSVLKSPGYWHDECKMDIYKGIRNEEISIQEYSGVDI